jgi:hypothetical protein
MKLLVYTPAPPGLSHAIYIHTDPYQYEVKASSVFSFSGGNQVDGLPLIVSFVFM